MMSCPWCMVGLSLSLGTARQATLFRAASHIVARLCRAKQYVEVTP
jgi:hypothetical protein